MSLETLVRKIEELRRRKNAVILAHNYQRAEVQDVADFVGDSLELARRAAETDADVIVFCGVDFMAETTVVQVCDGAGTVVAADSRVVQGIGGAMSGLAETSPIPEVIAKLKAKDCLVLDEMHAMIDQAAGLKFALEKYNHVGVTVCSLDDAERCREVEAAAGKGKTAILFGVHITGMSEGDAERFMELVDITTACASKHVRRLAGRALAQVGVAVPIFAMTETGKELLLNRIKYLKRQVLIKTAELPELPEDRQPRPLL